MRGAQGYVFTKQSDSPGGDSSGARSQSLSRGCGSSLPNSHTCVSPGRGVRAQEACCGLVRACGCVRGASRGASPGARRRRRHAARAASFCKGPQRGRFAGEEGPRRQPCALPRTGRCRKTHGAGRCARLPVGSGSASLGPAHLPRSDLAEEPVSRPSGLAPECATATKICGAGASTDAQAGASAAPARPPTTLCVRGVGAAVSTVHFRGGRVRQVGCNTVLSGCRPLWPPACCRDAPAPFVCGRSWGPLPAHEVESSLPALLTSGGPLGARSCARARCCARPAASQFGGAPALPDAAPLLYAADLGGARCPAGHFGGNQLPGSSIGLSPLRPGRAIELHVRTARGLHLRFRGLRPAQA